MRSVCAHVVILLTLFPIIARPDDTDPRSPAFWFDRAHKQLAVAPTIEYDGGTMRLTAFESAADLYQAQPTDENRQLVRKHVEAASARLEYETQPVRKWYAHLELARICRVILKDQQAYTTHVEAAAALAKWLPPDERVGVRFSDLLARELAAAQDLPALKGEVEKEPGGSTARAKLYAQVALACARLGQDGGARLALSQIPAELASVPSPGERDLVQYRAGMAYADVGDFAKALDVMLHMRDGAAKFETGLHVLRKARLAGKTDVWDATRSALADIRALTLPQATGNLVEELALGGDANGAIEAGRAALQNGPVGDPALYYAALARGLAAAGDNDDYAPAAQQARAAIGVIPPENAQALVSAQLLLAAAEAQAHDWNHMTATAASANRTASAAHVSDNDLIVGRTRLIEVLLENKRWTDAARQIAVIRAKRDRDAWMQRVAAAQVRAGELQLALQNARSLDGFDRAVCYRRVAIERAKKHDVADLASFIDELDTPLRRAAADLAVGQVLSGTSPRSAGFIEDED